MELLRLTIEDVGLIERAELTFARGLTVITGETGSGKTMLLDALAVALGERADAAVVRGGAERARVTLEIAPDDALRATLAEAGFALAPDDDLIVVREVQRGGRSQARIAGVAASASQVRAVAGALIDIVGQHAAQRLIAPPYALELLDRYAGPAVLDAREDVRRRYAEREAARERLRTLRDDGGALARAEFARFALAEIDAGAIEDDDEDERLRARREVLVHAERIVAALTTAAAALEDEAGAVDALGAAESALGALVRFGERFTTLAGAASALQSDANELAAAIARERDAVELDPAELDAVVGRLDALDALKKKYGGSLAAVRVRRERFAAEVGDVDERDARLAAAEAAVTTADASLRQRAAELSVMRGAAATALGEAVATELRALAMPAARLVFALEPLAEVGPAGAERVELRFSANPGETERPLARVASGGERSRVLLALVVVLADRRERSALVFDEIDAGIGGATATAVGARLAALARSAQVVCVTHLAQIASHGDAHVALRKHERKDRTIIDTVPLEGAERTAEIARMLSGASRGVALEHAAELLAARSR